MDQDRFDAKVAAMVDGFFDLFNDLMSPGALSSVEKELVALGIATTKNCDPCINLHIDKCLELGATPEEIMEAAGVGIVMAGGPACINVKKIANILKRKIKS
jgi:AhpD family alkylhydroperoxidase